MAVLAADSVTLASITDVKNVRRFYLLQSSTLAAPSVPSTNPPPASWGTGEPGYTPGATNSLYTVDLVVFSDNTFDYLPVQLSSSFEAAKSAYNKAQAAADAASAVNNQALSRGTDLVTNGSGMLGTNYNFTGLGIVDKQDVPAGALVSWSQPQGTKATVLNDEFIAVDPSKTYLMDAWVKQKATSTTAYHYLGLAPFDGYQLSIQPYQYMYEPGTLTTLAADLNPGDTTVKLTSPANWCGAAAKPVGAATHRRSIIWWDYVDPGGKAWPAETYSRNWSGSDYWADGKVATDGTITLNKAYAGPKRPAGTQLSNGTSAGSYMYVSATSGAPRTWARVSTLGGYSGLISGYAAGGAAAAPSTGFPPATAFVKIVFLSNWSDTTNSQHAWAGVSLSDASAAMVRATQASTAASQAKADAASANTAAANAAGIANGKADVLMQPSAPPAAMQKASTLWIDTTNAANVPKRWTGSAWVPVTDKTAIDAAAAAVAAKQAADAAQATADRAAAAAAEAQATATTAVTKADAAQTTASGKNKVLWSTSTPPDTAAGSTPGDIWNQYTLAENQLRLTATWQSDGSTWTSTALSETYLPQVNIGTGTYGELDGLRLKAKSVQAGAVLVDGSVGRVLIADGAITAAKADINDLAAATGAIIKLDVGQLVVTESSTFSTAVAQRMFVDVFAANKVTANELDAASVAAAVGVFVRVKAEQLDSGFLNASIGIGTSGAIMAGDWSKSYARIDDKGFSTYTVAEDGTQYMATSLGSATTNSLTIADASGMTRASITPDGDIAANSVTAAGDVSIAGADLIGQRLAYAGSSGASWLDTLPWGLAGVSNMGSTVAIKSVTGSTSEVITPLQVVTARVWPGRAYQVTMPFAYYARSVASGTNAHMGVRAYYTVGAQAAPTPANPSVSGGGVGYAIRAHSSDVGPVGDNLVFTITPSVDAGGPVQMKVMVASSVKGATMAYSVPTGGSWLLTVQDIGPAVPDTGYPVGGAAVSQFVSQWKASFSRSYDKVGADSYADYQQGILRHGGDALTHSAFVCNDGAFFGEKGKTIAQALTGATVTKVEIGLQSLYWKNASGGTLTLLPLQATSIAATDTSPGDAKKGIEKKFTTRSQWQWITVPTSWITPSSTGVRIGPTWWIFDTANASYFANHRHPSAPPQIRITYTRANAR